MKAANFVSEYDYQYLICNYSAIFIKYYYITFKLVQHSVQLNKLSEKQKKIAFIFIFKVNVVLNEHFV